MEEEERERRLVDTGDGGTNEPVEFLRSIGERMSAGGAVGDEGGANGNGNDDRIVMGQEEDAAAKTAVARGDRKVRMASFGRASWGEVRGRGKMRNWRGRRSGCSR
jgi:hypothetical protein